MGSRDGRPDERPRHRVRISQGFWLGRTPVTLAQYQRFVPDHSHQMPGHCEDNPLYPVVRVTWYQAAAFCDFLTSVVLQCDKDWLTWKARLPTEAQWEYACRGCAVGDMIETDYWCGDGVDVLERHGCFKGNSNDRLQKVGSKCSANRWGLEDMHGLVWEWCQDVYEPMVYSRRSDLTINPLVSDNSGHRNAARVLRGGSWFDSAVYSRSAFRGANWPGDWVVSDGFRVALLLGPSSDQRIDPRSD